jgi:hypothetical protein
MWVSHAICRLVAIQNYVGHVCKVCKIAQHVVILLVGSAINQLDLKTS